jgi:hypothetical protein
MSLSKAVHRGKKSTKNITDHCMDPALLKSSSLRFKFINVLVRASRTDPRHNKSCSQSPVEYDIYCELSRHCRRDSVNGVPREKPKSKAMRKGLHSNTFLHTLIPDTPAPHHEQRSLEIWREGSAKVEAHLALQLSHLKAKTFGNVVVSDGGDITIFYHIGYSFASNAERHTKICKMFFSYAVLHVDRQFRLDPKCKLSADQSTWLERYAQRLPRALFTRRPELEVSENFFHVRCRHIELHWFGVIRSVQQVQAETEADREPKEAEGETARADAGEAPAEMGVGALQPDEHPQYPVGSIPDSLRPEWYWPIIAALESSPDPAAAAAIESLRADHANVELQRTVSKLTTCDRFFTPAAAVSYLNGGEPRAGLKRKYDQTAPSLQPPSTQSIATSPPVIATRIADGTFHRERESRQKKIAEIRLRRQRNRAAAAAGSAAAGRADTREAAEGVLLDDTATPTGN